MQIFTLPSGESLVGLTLDEYNELLIIKGKYEELKEQKQQTITYTPVTYPFEKHPTLTWPEKDKEPTYPYKITCTN